MHLSDLRGKPVVLNFWTTWCRPCGDEMKYFVRAHDTYGSRVAIEMVSTEEHDVAAAYLHEWNINLPLVDDPDGSISTRYGVPPIPVTVVVDPAGTVVYVSIGGLSWEELRDAIERALAPAAIGTPAV